MISSVYFFLVFLSTIDINHHNNLSFLSDIADDSKVDTEAKLCAVNLPEPRSLAKWHDIKNMFFEE